MKRQLSLGEYRAIDLSILLLMQTFSQLLIHFAVNLWFPDQLYVASPVAGITALVMMRWGCFAGFHAFLGGLLYALLFGGTWQHLLIYGVGNLFSLGAMLMLRGYGKEQIRQDGVLSLLFALAVQILMMLGRGGIALLAGYSAQSCLGFITTDALSILLTLLIIWIVRRMDGLFEDQKHYLLRMERERKAERMDRF